MSASRAWEARLKLWHDAYRKSGRGLIIQTGAPVRVGANGQPCGWAGVGPPDFVGVVDGNAVFFDAKHTTAKGWAASKVPPHQWRDLDRALAAGALTAIALRCPSGMWWLPWGALRETRGAVDCVTVGRPICPVQGWIDA